MKPLSSVDQPVSLEIEERKLFDPMLTDAIHLSLVNKIEHADKLPEYLFKKGIAVEILLQDIDGTLLLKLSRYEDIAYARLTNSSLICLNGLIEGGDKSLLIDAPLWNIEIAHMKGRTLSLACDINSALAEMLVHYPAQEAERIIVRRYKSLGCLIYLAGNIRDNSHQSVLHMGYHRGNFELSTEALCGTLTWRKDLTLWLNSSGEICTESKLINEDETVSTPDVEVLSIPLPYGSCKLANIQVLESEGLTAKLYLTFVALQDGQATGEEITKTLELAYGKDILFGEVTAIPDDALTVQGYLKNQAVRPI